MKFLGRVGVYAVSRPRRDDEWLNEFRSRREFESSERLIARVVLFIIGALVVLLPLYIGSGGFVIYLNHVAIAFASKPIAMLILEALIILLLSTPIILRVARMRLGFFKGFTTAFLSIFALYSFTSIVFFVLYIITTFTIIAILAYGPRGRYYDELLRMWSKRIVLLLLLLIALYIATNLYVPIASSQVIEVVRLDKPIDVDALRRFIPLMTAYAYAIDRIQIPTHTIFAGDSYVYFVSGRSIYNWIIEPNGFWNQVTKSPKGFVFVYGDVYPPQVEVMLRDVAWGLHNMRFQLLYFDTLYREIVLHVGLQYKPLMENNIEIVYNNELLILVPVAKWDRGFLHSIPILHGYAVVHEDGSIEFVSAEQALRDPRFRDIPILPEAIARQWAEIRRYYVGFLNYYLYQNTYVIRDVGTNPQPYLSLDRENKTWWIFVAEPPGTFSAKYIMYVSTDELKPRILVYELPEPMIGISKVESYIKQAYPMYDWSQLRIEEPIPLVVNNTLYWKVSVVTNDFRGLVLIALVNARTSQVTAIEASKWDFTKLGSITPEALLKQVVRVTEERKGLSIEDRIKQLEQLIQQMRELLNNLEKELEELKKQVSQEQTRT